MGFPIKIQRIKRDNSEQWYINFPSALAKALELERGEVVEWVIDQHDRIILKRKKISVKNALSDTTVKIEKIGE